MQKNVIVSFVAADRPGLVEQISTVIADHGGNWRDGRLSQLGGQFAGLFLVQLPLEQADNFARAIAALASTGINATITDAGEKSESRDSKRIQLEIIGPDRSGIVREVTRALKQADINVQSMKTRVTSAPMSSEPLFKARIKATVPAMESDFDLLAELDKIADEMTLEIDLVQLSS